MKISKGFTLIELMIVVAIISLLAAIALPVYRGFIIASSEKACLQEIKAYANHVFMTMNDQHGFNSIQSPNRSACEEITDASNWSITTTNKVITGTPKNSEARSSRCDLNISPSCILIP